VDRTTVNVESAEFLASVGQYQSKMDAIHKAVEEGDVRRVKSLIDRTSLATCRDRHGKSPTARKKRQFWIFFLQRNQGELEILLLRS
jgi:hypothetical protein